MISCVEWIPKGAADPTPKRYEISAAELAMLQEQADLEAKLEEEENEGSKDDDDEEEDDDGRVADESKKKTVDLPKIDANSLPADLRMDEYSSDEDAEGARIGNLLIGKQNSEIIGTHTDKDGLPVEEFEDEFEEENQSVPSMKVEEEDDDEEEKSDDESYEGDEELMGMADDSREYVPVDVEGLEAMKLSHGGTMYLNDEEDDDNDSDIEDTNLAPDDALIIVAKTEEDFATLAVHVYETKTGNLFVHHDIPLPSFPLCLAHGDINHQGGAGNYCAVGTFDPGIEIWNIDVLDVLEPTSICGGYDTSAADELARTNMARASTGRKQKPKKKSRASSVQTLRPGSHTDAVMALDWNKIHRQIIVSGSADRTVKLWDVTRTDDAGGAPAATLSHHADKVNAVAWHPAEGTLLATGSYDRTVALVDARSERGEHKKVKLPADCEAVRWDPFDRHLLAAASEDGTVSCWDVRRFGNNDPVWSFVAHEFGVSDFSYNSHVPGMLATCSVDKTVALWDARNVADSRPYRCGSKEMNVGKLFTTAFYPSTPWLLGCGGSGNELSLWDLSSEDELRKRFGDRLQEKRDVVDDDEAAALAKEDDDAAATKEKDFEAMMLAADAATQKTRQEATTKRKKKGKKKKKIHKAGS